MKVTKHAKQRMKERCGFTKGSADRMAQRALDVGMKHSDCTGNLKKYVDKLYLSNKTANNIRLYGGKSYIFHNDILITVIPIPSNLCKYVKKVGKR